MMVTIAASLGEEIIFKNPNFQAKCLSLSYGQLCKLPEVMHSHS